MKIMDHLQSRAVPGQRHATKQKHQAHGSCCPQVLTQVPHLTAHAESSTTVAALRCDGCAGTSARRARAALQRCKREEPRAATTTVMIISKVTYGWHRKPKQVTVRGSRLPVSPPPCTRTEESKQCTLKVVQSVRY